MRKIDFVAAAIAEAQANTQDSLHDSPQTMLLLNPDRGDRYLETVYNPEWLAAQDIDLFEGDRLQNALRFLKPVVLPSSIPAN